jgi:hypothetical protein
MLVGNAVRLSASNPMRQLCAPLAGSAERAAWSQAGARRNSFQAFVGKYGYPSGVRHPASWCMSPKAGGMSARYELDVTTSNSGAGAMGVNGEGTTSITVTNADAALQLVVSASGSVSIVVSAEGGLAGALYAVGSADILWSNADATLGALAGLFGEATIATTLSATARAEGWIVGAITPYTELSPESLASAVWNKVATDANAAGTMGEKLNDAGSASNPWTEVIESGLTAAEVLRLIAATLAGNATGLESGAPVFKSLDGTKDRITATYAGGTRTVTDRDAT